MSWLRRSVSGGMAWNGMELQGFKWNGMEWNGLLLGSRLHAKACRWALLA